MSLLLALLLPEEHPPEQEAPPTTGGATLRPRRIQPRPAWLMPEPVLSIAPDEEVEALLLCGVI